MHLLADVVVWLLTSAEPTPAPGNGAGGSEFLTDAPTWLKVIYVLGGGGIGTGLIGLLATRLGSGGGRHGGSSHDESGSRARPDKRAESDAERIARYLDKAEADLAAARVENDRLEGQVVQLTLQLQEVRDALSRSREAEAGARATIETLTGFLREMRGEGPTYGPGGMA